MKKLISRSKAIAIMALMAIGLTPVIAIADVIEVTTDGTASGMDVLTFNAGEFVLPLIAFIAGIVAVCVAIWAIPILINWLKRLAR